MFSGAYLTWSVVFFVLAIVAAAVGAEGVGGVSMDVARVFVALFLVLAIIALLL